MAQPRLKVERLGDRNVKEGFASVAGEQLYKVIILCPHQQGTLRSKIVACFREIRSITLSLLLQNKVVLPIGNGL